MTEQWNEHFDAIVIGSGFGGAVAITKMVQKKGLPGVPKPRILVLERGTWWRNPEGPGLRTKKTKKSMDILGKWQYWARPNDSQGLKYVANSIYKEHNPIRDAINPFFKDNDLGIKENRKGMYRLTRFSHDNGNVDVVSGSAVGGGSLFYSGVNLIPHKPVLSRIGLGYLTIEDFMEAGRWMKDFRGKINKINTKIPVPHYMPTSEQLADKPGKFFQLGAIPESRDPVQSTLEFEMPTPDLQGKPDEDYLLLDRARVLKRAMDRVMKDSGFSDGTPPGKVRVNEFGPLPLSIVEYDKENGDAKRTDDDSDSTGRNTFCAREGRCILGCLPSARHTLYKTLQKEIEKGNDITVLPLTKVSHIDCNGNNPYVVHFKSELDEDEGEQTRATATKVFLAAGCLGTTEIMLRSQEKFNESAGKEGLPLSSSVGKNFSTNGDFFGFSYNLPRDYKTRNHVDDNKRLGNANPTAGPTNTSHFYVVFGDGDDRVDINVEDAGIPSTFARLVYGLLPYFKTWNKFISRAKALWEIISDSVSTTLEDPDTAAREQAASLTERELLANVFFYNLMGAAANEPKGTFTLQSDGVGLDLSYAADNKLADWSVYEKHELVLQKLHDKMKDVGDGGDRHPELAHSPFWVKEKRVTVTHPLGGCTIGANSADGVVDEFGRVFDGSKPEGSTDVLEGLYIVDASAIPGALGVNPTYTIVTHAVRCMDQVVAST